MPGTHEHRHREASPHWPPPTNPGPRRQRGPVSHGGSDSCYSHRMSTNLGGRCVPQGGRTRRLHDFDREYAIAPPAGAVFPRLR